MKRILLPILVVGVLLLSACGAPTTAPEVEESTTAPEAGEPATEPIPEPEPIEFSGQGNDVFPKFTLEEGITVITMTHSGSSNFQLELLNDNGETVDWLVNEIGSFDGCTAIGVREDNWMGTKPGIHLLGISKGAIVL